MVYLAILLILCGLLIVITALSVETGIVKSAGASIRVNREYKPVNSSPENSSEDIEIIFPGEGLDDDRVFSNSDDFIAFDDEKETADEFDFVSEDELPEKAESDFSFSGNEYSENSEIDSRLSENGPEHYERHALKKTESGKDPVYAVMFDDSSNIIDYEAGAGVIDSTFSKYKSIKRIGRGRVESDYDGISFYIDEKLYRFDFHKVYDIWSGENYIALPLKGKSTIKLFIIENPAGFPIKVENDFKEYEKGL